MQKYNKRKNHPNFSGEIYQKLYRFRPENRFFRAKSTKNHIDFALKDSFFRQGPCRNDKALPLFFRLNTDREAQPHPRGGALLRRLVRNGWHGNYSSVFQMRFPSGMEFCCYFQAAACSVYEP